MPQIGDIGKAQDLGYKGFKKRIWAACEICGKERWTQLRYEDNTPVHKLCSPCRAKVVGKNKMGANHPRWKGGRRWWRGYLEIRIYSDDFFYPMTNKSGYVREHRLVMAKHLNRCLLPWEIVHHKGTKYASGSIENRSDNRMENLELLPSQKYHVIDTLIKTENKRLHNAVDSLKREITLLKALLKKK